MMTRKEEEELCGSRRRTRLKDWNKKNGARWNWNEPGDSDRKEGGGGRRRTRRRGF